MISIQAIFLLSVIFLITTYFYLTLPTTYPDEINSVQVEKFDATTEQSKSKEAFTILMVCYNDTYVYKTAHSIMTNTSDNLLGEILIIDDLSPMKIYNIFQSPKVRIIRSDRRLGLIGARALGGDNAAYNYIAMIDCHVKVARNWLDEPYHFMSHDYRTLVNPTVFVLNKTTFSFTKQTSVMSSGGFTWGGDFFWGGSIAGTVYSAITVGEFFISKKWWDEIGGMDDGMQVWGGENIDISLKTWLCGGNIVCSKHSMIAHGFGREYTLSMPVNTVSRNLARSFEVWMGEKHIDHFYSKINKKRGVFEIGNISKAKEVKERLKCHEFDWYIEKFKGVSPCETGNEDKNRTCGKSYAVDWNEAINRLFSS